MVKTTVFPVLFYRLLTKTWNDDREATVVSVKISLTVTKQKIIIAPGSNLVL